MTPIRGQISRDLNIVLICLTSVVVSLRFYVRGFMTKSLGLDDAFTFVATCLVFAMSALDVLVVKYGAGTRIAELPVESLRNFFNTFATMQLLLFLASCFVRLAIIAFLPRLSKERKVKFIAWALGAFVVALTTACFFAILLECKHIPDLWDTLKPTRQCLPWVRERYIFFFHGGCGILVDTALLVIPMWILYSRMVYSQTTKRVMLVFTVGIFVVATGVVRLGVIANTNISDDTTFVFIRTSVWTDLEVHVGLWVACFPAIQPLIRIALRKVGLSTNHHPTQRTPRGLPLHSHSQETKTRDDPSGTLDQRHFSTQDFSRLRPSVKRVLEEKSAESDWDVDTEIGSDAGSPRSVKRTKSMASASGAGSDEESLRASSPDGREQTRRERVADLERDAGTAVKFVGYSSLDGVVDRTQLDDQNKGMMNDTYIFSTTSIVVTRN